MDVVWGAVCRPKQGQTISGDTYVVQDSQDGQLLASVIDGLGGGVEAAEASQQAAVILKRYPYHPLDELIRETHMALRSTRGAVIGVMQVKVYERRMSFIGVGNIGIYVYSDHPIKPISKNGILGYRLPTLLQLDYSYNSGDTFVLYSDGVSSRFGMDSKLDSTLPPQALAEKILQDYGKTNDDATVLVLRG